MRQSRVIEPPGVKIKALFLFTIHGGPQKTAAQSFFCKILQGFQLKQVAEVFVFC